MKTIMEDYTTYARRERKCTRKDNRKRQMLMS